MADLAYLTLDEAAERLSRSVSELKDLLLAGNIPFQPGRPVLIAENALISYLGSARKGHHSNANREEILEQEYSELGVIFEEVARRNGGNWRVTPLIKKLLKPFNNLPSSKETQREARIAFLLHDQRQADPKLQKQKERQASEAAKRRAAALKRNEAVKERQAKKAAAKPKPSS